MMDRKSTATIAAPSRMDSLMLGAVGLAWFEVRIKYERRENTRGSLYVVT